VIRSTLLLPKSSTLNLSSTDDYLLRISLLGVG
jgi:hypothetical protein